MPIPVSYSRPIARLLDDDDNDLELYNDWYRSMACTVLERSNVPFVVWFADAESFYRRGYFGVGALEILVHDMDAAAATLKSYGWQDKPLPPPGVWPTERNLVGAHAMADPAHVQRRMYLPALSPQNVRDISGLVGLGDLDAATARDTADQDLSDSITLVLLRDSEWGFDVERHWMAHGGANARARGPKAQQAIIIPPLHQYVDALITKQREMYEPGGSTDHLVPGVALTELYYFDDRKHTTLPALKDPGFTDRLSPENRQWHLDGLTGKVWERDYDEKAWEARRARKRDQDGEVAVESRS